jgi:hypothetical protein
LDAYDFYRVEGHIGREEVYLYPPEREENEGRYKVEEALRFLIQKYNLDFELVVWDIDKLTEEYSLGDELTNSFKTTILGAEHLGGVPKGGTFILVLDNGVAVADFCLPYRCCADNIEMA